QFSLSSTISLRLRLLAPLLLLLGFHFAPLLTPPPWLAEAPEKVGTSCCSTGRSSKKPTSTSSSGPTSSSCSGWWIYSRRNWIHNCSRFYFGFTCRFTSLWSYI
ncbi:hypothetical protein ACMD2_09299, partial [Ananas comosus]